MNQVGEVLAKEISTALERGLIITFCHRDYCGMGLRYHEGVFIYDESHDSTIATDQDLASWREKPSSQRITFMSAEPFVSWLASQTDASLSGAELENHWFANNQRLTIQRLKKAVEFTRSKPVARWGEYAG